MDIEEVGHETGRITSRRVLEENAETYVVESSFETQGQALGVEVLNMGTFTGRQRADGSLYGEGRGILATPEGLTVPWRGSGVGKRGRDGSVRYQAAIYLDPSATKLDELSRTPLLVEFNVSADGEIDATSRRQV